MTAIIPFLCALVTASPAQPAIMQEQNTARIEQLVQTQSSLLKKSQQPTAGQKAKAFAHGLVSGIPPALGGFVYAPYDATLSRELGEYHNAGIAVTTGTWLFGYIGGVYAGVVHPPEMNEHDLMHFGAGAGIAGLGYAGGKALRLSEPASILVGIGAAAGAGLVKEYAMDGYEPWSKHRRDLIGDVTGGVVGSLLTWAIDQSYTAQRNRKVAEHNILDAVHTR